MRFSIRYQLLLPLLMLILGVIGISAWTAWSSAARARQQIEEHMEAVARTVQSVTILRSEPILKLMKGLSGADFLFCDVQGRPARDKAGKPIMTLADLPERLPSLEGEAAIGLGVPVEIGSEAFFCRAVPLGSDRSPGFLLVFYPEALYRDAIWQAIRPALVLGAVGGLVSIILTVALTQRMTRRIQELERRTRLIAAGDFSPMPVPEGDDELRDLAGSVNDMAQQLARYQETMRTTERLRLLGQVSGGLAHQLRNGVTGARLAVQLHARDCPQDAETLEVALRQLALVEMHLKRFLDLGRAGPSRRERCDLTAILRETIVLLGPQSRHAHIDLRWRGATPDDAAIVAGDSEQLGHLFLNILTNAIEAAGGGGWVEVTLQENDADNGNGTPGRRHAIEIRDSGPGPDPQVAPRLFEAFVTGKPEGVGLGLAVAQQVAQAHGGRITWRRIEGVTCFRIELPAAPHDIVDGIVEARLRFSEKESRETT